MTWQCALGEYDAAKRSCLENILRSGMSFVDVGANMGYFSLLAANIVGSNGRVLAIEPEPENRRWLSASVDASGADQVSISPLALSDQSGEAVLHLGEKSGWHTLNAGQRNRDAGAVTVKTATLDAVCEGVERVDCIKIDVEGHEHRVLGGAMQVLNRHRPVVLLDTHPQLGADLDEIGRVLQRIGYQAHDINEPETPLTRLPEKPADLILTPLDL